ncbi:MAG: hypothetical protein V1792_08270 [Pseudomonadota bacterium]
MRHTAASFLCMIVLVLVSFPAFSGSPPKWLMKLLNAPPTLTFMGGSICPPAPHRTISMERMEITIRSRMHTYVVDALYYLYNTGEDTTERIGFPKQGLHNRSTRYRMPLRVHDFLRLETWVNSRKTEFVETGEFLTGPRALPSKHDPPDCYAEETRWMVKEIRFPALAPTTVRVRYEGRYHHPTDRSLVTVRGYYYSGTAQYWKGKIGKAVFLYDNTEIGCNLAVNVKLPLMAGPKAMTARIQRFERGEYEPGFRECWGFGP